MAIKYIIEHQFKKTDILFCVDSKSVIQAIETDKKNHRGQIIAEIKLFLHDLLTKGFKIVFFWIPSHCSIMGNESADILPDKEQTILTNSTHIHIPFSINEIYSQLHSASQDYFNKCYQEKELPDLHPLYYIGLN